MNIRRRDCLSSGQLHTSDETAIYVSRLQSDLAKEEAAFRRMAPETIDEYKGQFIALSGGKIVDHDRDELSLVVRVSGMFKDQFVLIERVDVMPAGIRR